MNPTVSIIHLVAAGIWLGGLFFTAFVVSPAFRSMSWSLAERIEVRSAVGRQYIKVTRVNLAVLLVAAAIDASGRGWNAGRIIELALIIAVFVLAELHGGYFGPRLAAAAQEGQENLKKLLRTSISISMLNLLLSLAVMVLGIVNSVTG